MLVRVDVTWTTARYIRRRRDGTHLVRLDATGGTATVTEENIRRLEHEPMQDFLKLLFDPFAMMGKSVEVAEAYSELLEAQTAMLRAMADYTEKLRAFQFALMSAPFTSTQGDKRP